MRINLRDIDNICVDSEYVTGGIDISDLNSQLGNLDKMPEFFEVVLRKQQ